MSLFNRLDNNIGYPLSKFDWESSSLQIDQLVRMNEENRGNSNIFMQNYIKNWLVKIFFNIQKSISISTQAGSDRPAQILVEEEVMKLVNTPKINEDPVDYIIAFPFEQEGFEPEQCKFIKEIKKFSNSSNTSVNAYFQAPFDLSWNESQLGDKDYLLIFPIPFEGKNIYNTTSIEYLNSISSLLAAFTIESHKKNILLAYEFLDHFDKSNKRKFFRSFISNILETTYRRRVLLPPNISLLMGSTEDVELFHSVFFDLINLLRYNSPQNNIDTLDSFITNHPYIKDGSIIDKTVIIDNKEKEFRKRLIIKPKKTNFNIVKELQGEVESDDLVYLEELYKIHFVKDLKDHKGQGHSILLLGESGTGKTERAQSIHKSTAVVDSKHPSRFVAINCAAIPSELIESELFGYAKGSHNTAHNDFDGKIKLADNGTLFLDEIGKAPLNVQSKILTFLDEKKYNSVGSNVEKKVNTRIIFATNEDPLVLIRQGKLLPDFYYRISKLKFTIPPLRERPSDLEKFILHFKRLCGESFKITVELKDEALRYMLKLKWPGNIRQVENTIYQIFVECKALELNEITKQLVEKYIEKIPSNNNIMLFTNFDVSFRSFFEYWKSIRSEFDDIQTEKAKEKNNDGSVSSKKNNSNNSHSFLKLIIEPMAAHTYDSMNLEDNKVSKILGLSLGSGEKYSPFQDRLNLYPKIKKVFEKLEN